MWRRARLLRAGFVGLFRRWWISRETLAGEEWPKAPEKIPISARRWRAPTCADTRAQDWMPQTASRHVRNILLATVPRKAGVIITAWSFRNTHCGNFMCRRRCGRRDTDERVQFPECGTRFSKFFHPKTNFAQGVGISGNRRQ